MQSVNSPREAVAEVERDVEEPAALAELEAKPDIEHGERVRLPSPMPTLSPCSLPWAASPARFLPPSLHGIDIATSRPTLQ